LPNGVETRYAYDAAGRLVEVAHSQEGESLARYTYTLNGVGNRTQVTETILQPQAVTTTRTITYTYDALNRLTDAVYSSGEFFAYAYNAVGNRTALTTTAGSTLYAYDAANRLTSVGGVTYTWDARGNLTNDGVFTYTYNAAGRMVRAQSLTATLAYSYSADGLRVTQAVDGVVTTFAWDAALPVAQVLASAASTAPQPTRYLHGLDLVAELQGEDWQYPMGDSLGSVRQVLDGGGAVTYAAGYTPFGEELWHAGETTSAWGYSGEWQDANVGMIYLRARWYAPGLGRFTRQDPWQGNIQQPGTANPYVYGLNNPLTCTDPTGNMCLGGFDTFLGGCSQERKEEWAQRWSNLANAVDFLPAFTAGFILEVADSFLLGGITIPTLLWEAWINNSHGPLLELALLVAENCGKPDGYKALRKPYTTLFEWPDPDFQAGRAWGRAVALGMALGELAFAFFGGGGLSGALASTGIGGPAAVAVATASVAAAAHAAGVIGVVIKKEWHDHLIWNVATGNTPGEGGGDIREPGEGIPVEANWGNPESRPAYGHSVSEHGAKRPTQELVDRARGTGNPQGQWYDDMFIVEAEQLAPLEVGENIVEMSKPAGRVIFPDGSIVENVTVVKVIRRPNLTVKTSFPFVAP
jgi:RHS repeat-associated protein